jgi:thymidylate synthase
MELYYHKSLEEAMQQTLINIQKYGYTTSPRDKESKEILGYNFIIENPRNRLVSFKERNLNPFYLVGNLLWVLNQSNKLEFINYYNPHGVNFSDDGEILRGAYGKRIFDFDGVNQWQECIKELKLDKDSRRAIITFHLPQHDWTGSLDTPCTASIQFFIRNNRLNLICHMRSQSAAFVMPYDIFLMTMLQELMANELKVEIGYYQHFCGSLHYFSNEEIVVNNIISSIDYNYSTMPKMIGGMSEIKKLLYFEKLARFDTIKQVKQSHYADLEYLIAELDKLNLPKYFKYIGEVLIAKAIHFSKINKYKNYVESLVDNPFKKLLIQFK